MLQRVISIFFAKKRGKVDKENALKLKKALKIGSIPKTKLPKWSLEEITLFYPYKGFIFIPESLLVLKGDPKVIVTSQNQTLFERRLLNSILGGVKYFDFLNCGRQFQIFTLPQELNMLNSYNKEKEEEEKEDEIYQKISVNLVKSIRKRLPQSLPCEEEIINTYLEEDKAFIKQLLNLEVIRKYSSLFYKVKEQVEQKKGIKLDLCRVFSRIVEMVEMGEIDLLENRIKF